MFHSLSRPLILTLFLGLGITISRAQIPTHLGIRTTISLEKKVDLFEPAEWVELFDKAGAKYVVLTSKHHDGYAL